MSHYELVKALEGDKGNSSHRLRPLESQGWIVIDRTSSGRAASLARQGIYLGFRRGQPRA